MRRPKIYFFDEYGFDRDTLRSFKLIILGVAFGVICFNITNGVAINNYIKALGASDFVFGLIFAIRPVGSTIQLLTSYILERTRKRKFLMITFGLIQRTLWLPFGLVPFFVPMEMAALRLWMVAFFLVLIALSNPFIDISFLSLCVDLIPSNIRGRFFGLRARVYTIMSVLGGLLSAWLLDRYAGNFAGYAIVFAIAALTGLIDIVCFFWVKFPPMSAPEETPGFISMVKTVIRDRRFVKFTLIMTACVFAANLSAPFYIVHLTQNLPFSAMTVTLFIQVIPNICSILAVTRWGSMMDRYSNKTVIRLAGGILCAVPCLWVFVLNYRYSVLILVFIALLNGLFTSGFDIAVQNMMFGLTPQENRSMFFSIYAMTTTLAGIGFANAAGGWLLEHVFAPLADAAGALSAGGVVFSRYNLLFALTAILRAFTIFVLLPHTAQEANTVPVKYVLHSIAGGVKYRVTMAWQLMRLKRTRRK